ncbi:MAG: o-succinylbenzoate synthase [FCB group bacterium]|nr:o-succinylbenzoate synthase [FCB group bacterium]
MKIKSVEIKHYCRNFIKPLITSRGKVFERAGYVIRLTTDDGIIGLGEAAPLIGFSPDSLDQTGESLFKAEGRLIEQTVPDTLKQISSVVTGLISRTNPAARFGLETALADLAAQKANLPLNLWLYDKAQPEVKVNFLLSRPVEDWESLRRQIINSGYEAIKIKVGGDIDDDVDFVRQVRQNLGERVALRLDANGGWSYAVAEDAMWRLKNVDIKYIEEPHETFDPVRVRDLRRVTGARVALDESLYSPYEIETLITGGVCDVFIFKPALLGGIFRTIELAALAKQNNRQVVLTSTLETEICLAAQLHLSSVPEFAGSICGLDTLRLFEKPDQALSDVSGGTIKIPVNTGLGIDRDIWNRV